MSAPDLSEFKQLDRKRTLKRPPCQVAEAISRIPKEDVPAVQGALDAGQGVISNKAIEMWFDARGVECRLQMVSAHRRGVCACASHG